MISGNHLISLVIFGAPNEVSPERPPNQRAKPLAAVVVAGAREGLAKSASTSATPIGSQWERTVI
jgi:hypothetical protein